MEKMRLSAKISGEMKYERKQYVDQLIHKKDTQKTEDGITLVLFSVSSDNGSEPDEAGK